MCEKSYTNYKIGTKYTHIVVVWYLFNLCIGRTGRYIYYNP